MNTNNLLLTLDEIKEIGSSALLNPQLGQENAINFFGDGHKTIYRISPINGLIFIKGTAETGFEHIHSRHEFWSTNSYWVENIEGGYKLDNPSRFNKNSIPILDYISISDSIYSPKNINKEKNHTPEFFDLYSGEYSNSNDSISVFHLLTYKNTKIVHTLYPQSKKNNTNKPSKFNFTRGGVTAKDIAAKNFLEIKIPYLNRENRIIYSIVIHKHAKLKLEKAFVFIHNKQGESTSFVYLGERSSPDFESITKELITYQHTDLRVFERHILAIDKKINEKK